MLVDHAEPALFEIERELVDERGFPAALPVLADVKNRRKMRQVFETYRPAVVFHAAAYKHVPLIESNPVEAVRNNTLATRTLAEVAVEFGAGRFVLISTDKAVEREDRDGAVEGVVRADRRGVRPRADVATRFVAVRFGNVLGSSGSVIPIFRRQIAARRPGDGHAPGDDPVLHDDPRGCRSSSSRPARSAAAARSSCLTWASR